MFGGLITNAVLCGFLIVRNGTAGEFVGRPGKAPDADGRRPPLLLNYLLAAFGGTLWYFQFFFYTMGESQMGRFGFSSWTLQDRKSTRLNTVPNAHLVCRLPLEKKN